MKGNETEGMVVFVEIECGSCSHNIRVPKEFALKHLGIITCNSCGCPIDVLYYYPFNELICDEENELP